MVERDEAGRQVPGGPQEPANERFPKGVVLPGERLGEAVDTRR